MQYLFYLFNELIKTIVHQTVFEKTDVEHTHYCEEIHLLFGQLHIFKDTKSSEFKQTTLHKTGL